jgi:hypothetical protein
VLPNLPVETEESDLLSVLGGDRTPARTLTDQITHEIAVWQSEPSMEIRYKGSDGEMIYNSVFTYWRQVKPRFPLLAPIAQQVFFFQCYF